MLNLLERITVNPQQCGGCPCIRGMRIRVSDVLDLFAAGLQQFSGKSTTVVGANGCSPLPTVWFIERENGCKCRTNLGRNARLEADDLKAALLYAARKLDHPVLVA